jgi:hypothetical protein
MPDMALFEQSIPPGLYVVSYYHEGWRGELPALDLERARREAKDISERYGVIVDIDGIGPEKGFHQTFCTIPKPIGEALGLG